MAVLGETTLTQMFLENPWPAVIALVGVSAVLRLVGKRQGEKRLVLAGWIALVLGLGVYLLATLVDTDRETLIARTHMLVKATSPADEAALADLIADRAVLLGPDGNFFDDLTAGFIARELREHDVQENALRAVDAISNRPGQGVSTMDVSSRLNGYPMRTEWELAWQNSDDGTWRLTSMKWLSFNQQTPSTSLYR